LINWNLIETVKELSLEYFDEYYVLHILVSLSISDKYNISKSGTDKIDIFQCKVDHKHKLSYWYQNVRGGDDNKFDVFDIFDVCVFMVLK